MSPTAKKVNQKLRNHKKVHISKGDQQAFYIQIPQIFY